MSVVFETDNDEITYVTVRKALHEYDEATEEELAAAFTLEYTDPDDQDVTFASYDIVMDYFRRMRGSFYFEAEEGVLIGDALQEWWSRRGQTYGWLDENLGREDYDPLENYDRKEDGGWKDDHDIGVRSGTDNLTDTYAPTQKTTTETPRAEITTTTTPGVISTTESAIYGDNSSTEVPQNKVTVTPDATNPDVVKVAGTNGTDTTVEADIQRIDTHNRSTSSLAAKDTDTRLFQNYRVHGNIGVSTVADMLTKEVELRRGLDLVKLALNEFLDLYTFYVS